MAKQRYRTLRFRDESWARIEQMNEIIEEYQGQQLRLTARQLYYQLVSRDLIPNLPAEYKKLTALLTDARYAGLVDWDAIEDRGREPSVPSQWNSIGDLCESALRAYRLPRWKGQSAYCELWVEKQALAGVLEPLASEHHVTLMVNKGYSSASAMKESAERIRRATIEDEDAVTAAYQKLAAAVKKHGKTSAETRKAVEQFRDDLAEAVPREAVVFYLGDHDPSGEDMVRDISERLEEFGVHRLNVVKVGLTIDQVRKYNPPPNPAKITDPRAKKYIAKFGDKSWEVDALDPATLARLIRASFRDVIDLRLLKEIKAKEETDKERLRDAVARMQADEEDGE